MLTKQTPTDNTLKLHLAVEENNKATEAPTICFNKIPVNPEIEQAPQITRINNEIVAIKKRMELAVPEIYNLENCSQNEKPMKIDLDLDLYQMEKP